ncbi:MAG: hypothetical protein JSU81_10680 [Candidatus Coatesbacteria bacterium]|nr:MAG: hypothetical protein JSU81_10680 [Candidatus Coatesbacteria bacterium]
MPIDDEAEAEALADKLAAEMVASLDADMLSEAKSMGMATSVFAAQIEEYRAKFNAEVSAALAEKDLFGVAASRLLIETE